MICTCTDDSPVPSRRISRKNAYDSVLKQKPLFVHILPLQGINQGVHHHHCNAPMHSPRIRLLAVVRLQRAQQGSDVSAAQPRLTLKQNMSKEAPWNHYSQCTHSSPTSIRGARRLGLAQQTDSIAAVAVSLGRVRNRKRHVGSETSTRDAGV